MSFADPIESGNALILDNIHSPNYVAGTSGWTINKDGTAEFASLALRGSWEIAQGSIHIKGYVKNGITPVIEYRDDGIGTYCEMLMAGLDFKIYASDVNGAVIDSYLAFDLAGRDIRFGRQAGSTATLPAGVMYDSPTGYLQTWTSSGGVVEGWQDLTLHAGWTVVGTQTPQFRRQPDGTVRMRGVANTNAGAPAAGTVAGTLPTGYRPGRDCYAETVYDSSATRGRAIIRAATGNIELYDAPNATPGFDMMNFSIL